MRSFWTMVAYIALVGTAAAQDADEHKLFSLEYCPSTPTPTAANGQAPSALTAKYGPKITKEFKPYIGTGLAYSLPSPKEKVGEGETGLKTGLAGQAGFSLRLSENSAVDFDYKYLRLAPDPLHNGNTASPHLFGIRLGCSF
jgi:outer membrane protein W